MGVGGDVMAVVVVIVGRMVGRHVSVGGMLHGRVVGMMSIVRETLRAGSRLVVVLNARSSWEKAWRWVPCVLSSGGRYLRASMTRLFTKVHFTVVLPSFFFHKSLRLGLHKTFGESLANDGVDGDGRISKLLGPTLVLYIQVCLTCLVGQLTGSGFREASCSAFVAEVDVFDFGFGEIPILIYFIHR